MNRTIGIWEKELQVCEISGDLYEALGLLLTWLWLDGMLRKLQALLEAAKRDRGSRTYFVPLGTNTVDIGGESDGELRS